MGKQIRGGGALRRPMIRSVQAWSAGGIAAILVGLLLGGPAALAQSYAPNTGNRVIVDYGAIDAIGTGVAPMQQPAYGMAAPAYSPPAYPGYNNYYATQQPYGYGAAPYYAPSGYAMPLGP